MKNKNWVSNIMEIQRIEIARYTGRTFFFYFLKKLNNQCKLSRYNFNKILLFEWWHGILWNHIIITVELFFAFLEKFLFCKNKTTYQFHKIVFFLIVTRNFINHIIINLCCHYMINLEGTLNKVESSTNVSNIVV